MSASPGGRKIDQGGPLARPSPSEPATRGSPLFAEWFFLLPLAEGAMDDPVRFIDYKGKQILLIELSRPSAHDIGALSKLALSYITPQPLGSVLLLADFTGATLDKKTIEVMKPALVLDRPYLKRSAWVGTENIPKTLYEHLKSFSRRDLPTFKTREEAMEWLVNE